MIEITTKKEKGIVKVYMNGEYTTEGGVGTDNDLINANMEFYFSDFLRGIIDGLQKKGVEIKMKD